MTENSCLSTRTDKKIKIYAIGSLIAVIGAIVIRTICLFDFYDADIGYYTKDFLPMLLDGYNFAFLFFILSSVFVVKKDTPSALGVENNAAIRAASAICVLTYAAFFLVSVLSTALFTSGTLFDLLSKLTALTAIVYFSINLFGTQINRKTQTLCGFGIIIWNIYILAVSYFDVTVQLNSPDKIILHLAIISVMIFLTNEFRSFLNMMRKKFYLISLCAALFFTGLSAVPSMIYGISTVGYEYRYFLYDVIFLSLFAYCAARLVTFAFAKAELIEEEESKAEQSTEDVLSDPENNDITESEQ